MREEEPAAVITAEKTASVFSAGEQTTRAFSCCEKEVNGAPA
jgi:hypothetical protein